MRSDAAVARAKRLWILMLNGYRFDTTFTDPPDWRVWNGTDDALLRNQYLSLTSAVEAAWIHHQQTDPFADANSSASEES